MRVSVIIPVYNAEKYVRQAVESAVAQPETGEVLLIEDGSRDRSLQVCKQLADEHPQVRLLRHADHGNHGSGASRNLGILQSRCDYVAFLDADDYFLPGRFSVAGELFAGDPELDGVYEAIGTEYEDKVSELRWLGMGGPACLTTMTERVAPDALFERYGLMGPGGRCATGGWVVRRSIFARTGLFDEQLRLFQDIVMYAKFAAVGKMLPGRLDEPVAMRRIHPTNWSSQRKPPYRDYRARLRMWAALWRWGRTNLSPQRQQLVLERFLERARRAYRDPDTFLGRQLLPRLQLTGLALRYPDIVLEKPFWSLYVRTMLPSVLRRRLLRGREGLSHGAGEAREESL